MLSSIKLDDKIVRAVDKAARERRSGDGLLTNPYLPVYRKRSLQKDIKVIVAEEVIDALTAAHTKKSLFGSPSVKSIQTQVAHWKDILHEAKSSERERTGRTGTEEA